jgi:hypothetical protein
LLYQHVTRLVIIFMSITLSEVEPTTGLAPDFIATSTLSTELTFARAEAASLRLQPQPRGAA